MSDKHHETPAAARHARERRGHAPLPQSRGRRAPLELRRARGLLAAVTLSLATLAMPARAALQVFA